MNTTVILVTVAAEDLVRNRLTPAARIEERPVIAWREAPDGTLEPRCAGRIPAGAELFVRHPNGLVEALDAEHELASAASIESLILCYIRPDHSKSNNLISLLALTDRTESARLHAQFRDHLTPRYREHLDMRARTSAQVSIIERAIYQDAISARRARFA